MAGALGAIGSLAGGLNSTLAPLLQQYQQDTATGQGIYAMMGVTPPQQGGLGSLLGGSAPNVPVQAPQQMGQLGQGGTVQSPMPQPSAVSVQPPQMSQAAPVPQAPMPSPTPQQAPSPLPRGAPMVASAGQTAPVGLNAPQTTQPQAQQPAPQPQQPAQQSPTLQNQQTQPAQQPDLSHFDSQFDFNHLMQNLARAPGMNAQKLGRIARSPVFERMLNQQGLNQYRMLGLGIREQNAQTAQDRLSQDAEKFRTTTERLEGKQASQEKEHAIDKEEADLKFNYGQQNQRLLFGPSVGPDGKPIDKQAAAKKLDDDLAKAMGDIKKRRDAFNKESSDSSSSSAGNPLEEAKAAIAAGRNKQMVIERFKKLHPDLDASGL